jgi:hypothetical protein
MSDLPPQLGELSNEQKEALIRAIESAQRRQRIMMLGYIIALVAMLAGMVGSFWLYTLLPEDSFRGWVFLAPLSVVGGILWLFGHLARKRRT